MKKVIKVLGVCALVALAFTSCKKDEIKTFKATAAQLSSDDTKTHISGAELFLRSIVWDADNEISVVKHEDGDYRNFGIQSLSEDGKTAVFHIYHDYLEFMSDLATDNAYTAYYPYANCTGNEVRLTIPAVQTFTLGNIANNLFPMYGHNVDGGFGFTTDAGVLAVTFSKADTSVNITLDSLVFESKTTDEYIAGEMVYDNDGTNYRFEGTSKKLSIISPTPMSWPFGTSLKWTVIFPKDVFADGFIMKVYGDRGSDTYFRQFEGYIENNPFYGTGRIPMRAGWYVQMSEITLE